MYYPLKRFNAIPEAALLRLAGLGILDTDTLLGRAATPALRRQLSQESGVPVGELAQWTGIADLVRIKGIGPAYAELLVNSGLIDSVQGFLAAMRVPVAASVSRISSLEGVQEAAAELAKQLAAYARQGSAAARAPTARELTEAAEEAAELRPRLVLADPDESAAFRQAVWQRARKDVRSLTRIMALALGIMTAGVAVIEAVSIILINQRADELGTGDRLDLLSGEFLRVAGNYTMLNLTIVSVIVIVVVALLYAFYQFFSYVIDTRIVFLLFDAPGHRSYFRRVILTAAQARGTTRAAYRAMVGFAVIVVGAVGYFLLTLNQAETGVELISALSGPVALGGIVIGIIASAPRVRFYLKEGRSNNDADRDAIQRWLVYGLAQLAMIPIMVVLLTQVALPVAFDLQGRIYTDSILPPYRTALLERRAAIAAFKSDDAFLMGRRDQLLQELDAEFVDKLPVLGLMVSAEDRSVMDAGIPLALNTVVWLAFTGVALLFVLPYFALGGWLRGLFFMIVLAVSFAMEDILHLSAPTWFSLEPGSAGAVLVIAFVIFANALFFDWVFEALTARKKVCPGCHARLDESDLYCSVCGLTQP